MNARKIAWLVAMTLFSALGAFIYSSMTISAPSLVVYFITGWAIISWVFLVVLGITLISWAFIEVVFFILSAVDSDFE